MHPPTATVTQKGAARARAGHPWIFRADVARPPEGAASGAEVRIADARGNFIARGFWAASSPIALRVLSRNDSALDEELLAGRLRRAWERRKALFPRADAFRLAHGEADLLPGYFVDLYAGDFNGAYRVFNSTPLEKNPTLWQFQMGTVMFRLGREREAMDSIDKYLREYPNDEGGVGNSVRAMIFARAGRRADAEAAIAQAIKLGRSFGHFHHAAYNVASAYAMLGDRANALKWLQDASDDEFPCYPLFAQDAQLNNLRSDPGFIAFMTHLKAEYDERKRTFGDR
jgi:tetratricopeptide (TPR) repeat protein